VALKVLVASCWMIRPRPRVASNGKACDRPSSGQTSPYSTAPPSSPTITAAAITPNRKLPVSWTVKKSTYPPNMNSSPWAKLTISSTPNTNANPEATKANDEPTTRPFRSWMMRSCIEKLDVARIKLGHLIGGDSAEQLFLLRARYAVDVDGLRTLVVSGVHDDRAAGGILA